MTMLLWNTLLRKDSIQHQIIWKTTIFLLANKNISLTNTTLTLKTTAIFNTKSRARTTVQKKTLISKIHIEHMMSLSHIEEVLKKKLHLGKDSQALGVKIILKVNMISDMIKNTQMNAMKASTTNMKRWVDKIMEVNIELSNNIYINKKNLTAGNMMKNSKNHRNQIVSSISRKVSINKA